MGTDAPSMVAGRYRIGRLLGRGGMGEVFDGWDTRLERPVAVKLLRPELAHDPTVAHRFAQEARSAAGLVHPNVVAVHDSGDPADGAPYIVMERLTGTTLRDVLAAGPLAAEQARAVGLEILGALAAAHRAGIVHRDVKPGNVLLAPEGRWKVGDFGIAKSFEAGAADHTLTGMVVGSPAYLAPERMAGHAATPASDIYAVGVVLHEALTGTRPGPGPVATPLPADPALAAAIEVALRPDPAQRWAGAAEMAAAMQGFAQPSSPYAAAVEPETEAMETVPMGAGAVAVDGPAPPTEVMPAGARPGGRRLRRVAVAVAAVAAVALLALVLSQPGASRGGRVTTTTGVPAAAPTTAAGTPGRGTAGLVSASSTTVAPVPATAPAAPTPGKGPGAGPGGPHGGPPGHRKPGK